MARLRYLWPTEAGVGEMKRATTTMREPANVDPDRSSGEVLFELSRSATGLTIHTPRYRDLIVRTSQPQGYAKDAERRQGKRYCARIA